MTEASLTEVSERRASVLETDGLDPKTDSLVTRPRSASRHASVLETDSLVLKSDSLGTRPRSASLAALHSHDRRVLAQQTTDVVRQRLRRVLRSAHSGPTSKAKSLSPERRKMLEESREKEKEWWSFTQHLQENPPINFKFPDDPYAGQESNEVKIAAQACKGEQQKAEEAAQYWQKIDKMNQEQRERRRLERANRKAHTVTGASKEKKKQRLESEKQLRLLLKDMRENVESKVKIRPQSAPSSHSFDEEAQRKVEAARAAQQKQDAEYQAWLQTAQKPTLKLPNQEMSAEERARLVAAQAAAARAEREKSSKFAKEYQARVKELEKKHQERVEGERAAQIAWRRKHRKHIDEHSTRCKDRLAKQRTKTEKEHASLAVEIHERVRSKPLLVEESCLPPTFGAGKSFPHRRR